jgi:hypothetical protein
MTSGPRWDLLRRAQYGCGGLLRAAVGRLSGKPSATIAGYHLRSNVLRCEACGSSGNSIRAALMLGARFAQGLWGRLLGRWPQMDAPDTRLSSPGVADKIRTPYLLAGSADRRTDPPPLFGRTVNGSKGPGDHTTERPVWFANDIAEFWVPDARSQGVRLALSRENGGVAVLGRLSQVRRHVQLD